MSEDGFRAWINAIENYTGDYTQAEAKRIVIEEFKKLTEDRDFYQRAFLLLSKTRKQSDIRSAR